jgi:hypothetical protein
MESVPPPSPPPSCLLSIILGFPPSSGLSYSLLSLHPFLYLFKNIFLNLYIPNKDTVTNNNTEIC